MKYGLHDTQINDIVNCENGIVLNFNGGVYLLDAEGHETELTKPCKLVLKIIGYDKVNSCAQITVNKIYKSKITEIEFDEFLRLIKISPFSVISDYYSFFDASVMLRGYCGNYAIVFTVTDVESAEYVFCE